MINSFFEKNYSSICDSEVLQCLGVNDLFSETKINVLEYFSDDISVLKKRSVVFSDALRVQGLLEILEVLSAKLSSIGEILRIKTDIGDKERCIFSAKQLQLYFEIIDEAAMFGKTHLLKGTFSSTEFESLFQTICDISYSEEYQALKAGAEILIDKITHIKSVSVGFNFDARLAPVEMGVLSINDAYIESGKIIDRILRLNFEKNDLQALEPVVAVEKVTQPNEFKVLQESLLRTVDKLFTRSVNNWPKGITKYMEQHLAFLMNSLSDFKLIVAVTKIHKKLFAAGVPMSAPCYQSKKDRIYSAQSLYNPLLAIRMKESGDSKSIIGNDITFDNVGQVYVLTGPNNGGKTIFLASIGIAQVMAQLGMLVPAMHLEISPVDHLYVHFPKYLTQGKMGRLEDECSRIQKIFETINEYSLCLFDETFSSTDSEEGGQLALEILRSVEYYGARAIFGTHFHRLYHIIEEMKSNYGFCKKIDYLCAGIAQNRIRTYQILRASPEGHSYALGIADKYGLSYNELTFKK